MIESAIACAFCADNKSAFFNGYLRTLGFIIAIILILTVVFSFFDIKLKVGEEERVYKFGVPAMAGMMLGGLGLVYLTTRYFSRFNINKRQSKKLSGISSSADALI